MTNYNHTNKRDIICSYVIEDTCMYGLEGLVQIKSYVSVKFNPLAKQHGYCVRGSRYMCKQSGLKVNCGVVLMLEEG